MKKKKENPKLKRQAANFNRGFALVAGAVVLTVFGWMVFESKHGPDSSVNVQNVSSEILIKSHSPTRGAGDARVTIVEFFDLECESCRRVHFILRGLEREYGEKLRLVFRYLPLHRNSRFAAAALEEAREQGKFEEALEILFDRQPIWGSHTDPKPELIVDFLSEVGVNKTKLVREALLQKHGWKIALDEEDAKRIGVRKTPTFFINGRMRMTSGYEPLKEAIEFALKTASAQK